MELEIARIVAQLGITEMQARRMARDRREILRRSPLGKFKN